MLLSLTIKNIALIDELSIDLCNGFNVLTGETGAGKSLIIDSLALLLGEKADKSLISYGTNFASVEAVFETNSDSILDCMESLGLDRENTIVIFRKLTLDGKNECRVNGKTFTLSMLKQLTEPLMDLHGQFQHQELLKQENQLLTLDEYGGAEIKALKNSYKEVYFKLKQTLKQLSSFNIDTREREKLIDLYGYQIKEIEDANFVEGEEETLKAFRMKVLNQEKIALTLSRLENMFNGAGDDGLGAVGMLKKIDYEFADVVKYFPENDELAKRISSARYEIEDIAETVDGIKDNLYFDEFAAAENEKRLDLLTSLKKKYGDSIQEINQYLQSTKQEYEKLIGSAEIIERLQKQKDDLTNALVLSAEKLTKARKVVAEKFSSEVKNELTELSMKSAKFEIQFNELNEENCNENGFDDVEFLFTANAGQPLKPLSKVVSGGELSRFMLAVKNLTADVDKVDTMIFDEIDTGISGDTANVLATKLAKIGKKHQVICVTHLAQVASFGESHYLITKYEENGKTKTTLKLLNGEDRTFEIARLIGGKISDFSIEHAKLMLQAGKEN